ncbi:hypothetical protein HUN33_05095 [Acinetobacter bereziniae]|uniref:hypothetical protein n=1 Tax=Acinetobacter bereziniae TaxID=106648 RepID=UPI0015800365|nr:hypothetical protein [Acinetobacter bereziniae]MCU4418799.1 hypothetical protein [Acinetobacter bereziniae]NUF63953.1 hypothetical protein [Acinetobacter bereziniae]NUG07515.1 hypothetical protein [Acinetobacter bereziniae]NUG64892.1 hypothetical protein [Acinetobacter bereziniae]NUG70316.1 hypothetical protein [Acinetobacter bereziniae]
MKLIRKATNQTVLLENGFLWSDEFDWKPIEQKQDRAIDGALIVQEGKKKAGRQITLIPSESSMGWVKRRELSKIMDWSALQEHFYLEFDYPHDKRKFKVMFNHEAGAIEAKPVKGIPTVSEDDYYNVTMRFLELNDD